MKTRRGTIISCLCALAVTAAGAMYFTSGRAPFDIPVKIPEVSSTVSGLEGSANREAVGRQLLNAMPSLLGTQGRLVTLPQRGGSTQMPISGSAMEMSKPLPPGILSPDQNTESTDRLIGFNQGQNSGSAATPEEDEGGGVPPTTDVPVIAGEDPSKPEQNPDAGEGQSSQGSPEESVPEDPAPENPSDENASSDIGSSSDIENPEEGQNSENESEVQETSSSQSEGNETSSDAASQEEHGDANQRESITRSEESLP